MVTRGAAEHPSLIRHHESVAHVVTNEKIVQLPAVMLLGVILAMSSVSSIFSGSNPNTSEVIRCSESHNMVVVLNVSSFQTITSS